jgi:hypothetical protein
MLNINNILFQAETQQEWLNVNAGFVNRAEGGIKKDENPFLFSTLLMDIHRICPHDKFHADEDSSGHAPRDFALLEVILSPKVLRPYCTAIYCLFVFFIFYFFFFIVYLYSFL